MAWHYIGRLRPRHGLFAIALAWVVVSATAGSTRRLDRALVDIVNRGGSTPVRVFVHARDGQEASMRRAVADHHGVILSTQASLATVTATMTPAEIRALGADRRVAALSLDAPVRSMSVNSPSLLLESMGVASSTYSATAGAGVGIAIIDSGFKPALMDDFLKGPALFYDFTTGLTSPKASAPYDAYGHGTHVAGLIGGDGGGAQGAYRGLAPGAKLIHLKALDENGQGLTSSVVNAVNFAVANKKTLGIDVINMSLGHPIYEPAATDPLVQAVEQAVGAGIVVVVSAGNNGGDPETHAVGYAGINSPGNAPSAITVGALDLNGTATRDDDTIPWYSSRGPTWYDGYQKPDLVAPGHHMVSDIDRNGSLYKTYPQYIVYATSKRDPKSAAYFRLSGTSMSSATVAGAVAVVISQGRAKFGKSLPPNAVKALLQYTALPVANADMLTQGAGALNLLGAATLATLIDPTMPAGAAWLTTGVTTTTTIAGVDQTWAQRIIWGDRTLDGTALFANDPAWAERVVWGDRVVWGNRVVWGASTVWSIANRVVWGDRVVWGNSLVGYTTDNRVVWGNTAGLMNVDAQRVVWGDVANTTLGALSAPEDPFGVDTLDEAAPLARTRHHNTAPAESRRAKAGRVGAGGHR